MPGVLHVYPPEPEKIVNFVKLQVTDAMLDTNIFPAAPSQDAASVLFALGILSAIPPVPNNRSLLDDTFAYMQTIFSPMAPSEYVYNDVVSNYNNYLGVFEKSASLPKKGPMSNPYEEVSKAASYQLGFPEDGIRIFYLTVWLTHYCKDAITFFFADSAGLTGPARPRKTPTAAEAYAFVSKHVNNTITDQSFFSGKGIPGNATEVFTALYMVVVLVMPTRDKTILFNTLEYTNELLKQNSYSPLFFERIMQAMERFLEAYESSIDVQMQEPTSFTFELLAEETVKLLNLHPDTLLRYNIVAYFSGMFFDAMATLYPEIES